MGKIRIIGGLHKSRQLMVADAKDLRPTLDQVKETLFNWLGQDLANQSCLDLFAGSGSLGFEAYSRNARNVTMIDRNIKVVQRLLDNIKLLDAGLVCQVLCLNALAYLKNACCQFDVIFLDPPYQSTLLDESLILLERVLSATGVVYIECKTWPQLPDWLELVKSSKVGSVKFALLQRK